MDSNPLPRTERSLARSIIEADGWQWFCRLKDGLLWDCKNSAFAGNALTQEEYLELRGMIAGVEKLVSLIIETAEQEGTDDE